MGNCAGCMGPSHPALKEDYKVIKKLGSGYEGEVLLCQELQTSQQVAVKLIPLKLSQNKEKKLFSNNMEVLASLAGGHVSIVQTREIIVTREHLGFVMEYVPGGSLDQHCRKHKLTEEKARYIFRQIIGAVDFMHRHHIAHRDLKLQNIMLDTHDPPRVKLCDFGLSKLWTGPRGEMKRLTTFAGTPGYISPEMLKKVTNKADAQNTYDGAKADVFACGVVLVVMLLQHHPYQFSRYQYLSLREMLSGVYTQQITSQWNASESLAKASAQLSADCCDLLNRMLQSNEVARISIQEIQNHRWFRQPVSARQQEVLDDLARTQQRLEAGLSAFEAAGGHDRLRLELKQLRTTASEVATSSSSGNANPVGVLVRVKLTPDALRATAPAAPVVQPPNTTPQPAPPPYSQPPVASFPQPQQQSPMSHPPHLQQLITSHEHNTQQASTQQAQHTPITSNLQQVLAYPKPYPSPQLATQQPMQPQGPAAQHLAAHPLQFPPVSSADTSTSSPMVSFTPPPRGEPQQPSSSKPLFAAHPLQHAETPQDSPLDSPNHAQALYAPSFELPSSNNLHAMEPQAAAPGPESGKQATQLSQVQVQVQ